nr:hypothetical protein [uncultured Draconibacterium sp.]
MKKLALNSKYSTVENYSDLISEFTDKLKVDYYKNEQKIVETCHVGKFLMFFENRFKIDKISEEPDFIISDGITKIGLEHQILIDKKSKEKEGFFGNLIKQAEKELRKDKELPNFLANVYAHPFFNSKINEKQRLINEIVHLIKHFIKTGELLENEIIDRISSMKHSKISLSPNMGAWWQKSINGELIKNAVFKKEKRIDKYLENTNLSQWLLIVIGGLGESSYSVETEFDLRVKTKFDKVYLLEDFNTNLFEIK